MGQLYFLQTWFEKGLLPENKYFKSFKTLNEDQKKIVKDFTYKYVHNQPLCGRNKPNHLDKTGDYSFWHYHIGYPNYNQDLTFTHGKPCDPFSHKNDSCDICINFKLNNEGKTSSSVLHYVKLPKSEIIVFAYGEKHDQFPLISSSMSEKCLLLIKDEGAWKNP